MILNTNSQIWGGMLDFATIWQSLGSPAGGIPPGSYDLQIPIPAGNIPVEFATCVQIPLSGGSGTSISFDRINTSVNPIVTNIGYLRSASTSTFYNGGGGTPGTVVSCSSLAGSLSFASPNAYSIGFSLSGASLTQGQLQIFLIGLNFEFGQ